MSIQRGDTRRLHFTSYRGTTPTDPVTLTFTTRDPAGEETPLVFETDDELVRDSAGDFYVDVTFTAAGDWRYQWESTGPDQIDGGTIHVDPAPLDPPVVAPGPPAAGYGVLGHPVTANLAPPPGLDALGARIEVPVTREIVSAYTAATLITDPDTLDVSWQVELESPLQAGSYNLVWRTADPEPPEYEAFIPLTVLTSLPGVTVDESAWQPSVQDVADLCPAYTRGAVDGEGESAGAQRRIFDVTTDPTAETVAGFVTTAVHEVRGRVGVPIPARCVGLARRAAAWHAAASVEAERQPEAVVDADGAYRWKQASYVACLNELISQARPRALRIS